MTQIYIVFILTAIIHFINTLAYSVRIVGVRTGKIAISFALFNIVVLISRTANTIQAPLLAKTVENSIKTGTIEELIPFFRYIMVAATIGSIFAALFIPTFQRMYTKAVNTFNICKSIPRLLLYGFSKNGIQQFKENIKIPSKNNLTKIKELEQIPIKITLLNMVAVSMLTVGILSALYAGAIAPEFRTTSSTLSSIITGISTLILFIFIDPHLSLMTDEVINESRSEGDFRATVMFMIFGRILGTMLAQIIFLPSANIISYIATNVL